MLWPTTGGGASQRPPGRAENQVDFERDRRRGRAFHRVFALRAPHM